MTTTQELRKPLFIKVKDLQKSRSGYNVLVKVISANVRDIQTKSGVKIRMIDAVVGDQTAVAKAFFKGDNAKLIEKGKVIAIRNGVKKYIKNFISLELDIFGRVTEQKAQIKVNQSYNISEQQHKLSDKPRRDRNFSRGPRGNNNRRGNFNNNRRGDNYRRQGQQRRGGQDTRRNYSENRPQRRDYDNRRQQNRGPRQQYDRDFDRRRNNYDNRPPRRDDNRPPRRDDNRPPRRDDQPRYEQKPRYQPRQEFREKRSPPIQWTKIDNIQPGDDRLHLIVKVLSSQIVEGKSTNFRCLIGDQTGTVKAFLPESRDLVTGKSIAIFNCDAQVFKEHIEIRVGRYGRIEASRRQITRVNENFNLSDKAWVLAQN